jgi:thiamine pyrophosphate-dependent acetolactate synthase large subunit-like protein
VPVWQTSLVNPHFADFARSCGGWGLRVENDADLRDGLEKLANIDGPGILEVITDPLKI